MTSFLAAAKYYTSIGYKVFPLRVGSKIPAVKGGRGFKDATDDLRQIRDWARQFPRANITIATGKVSGIAVLDIDPRNGGNETIERLALAGQSLPEVPTVRTGNGGKHHYFRLPPGNLRSALGQGVDVKGDGGYVVAPPSVTSPSASGPGGKYSWLASPTSVGTLELPSWAISEIVRRAPPNATTSHKCVVSSSNSKIEGMSRLLSTSKKGIRNDLLNWAAYQAGRMVREGRVSQLEAKIQLTSAALESGLTANEVAATWESGFSAGYLVSSTDC